jgi:hypothetical protein
MSSLDGSTLSSDPLTAQSSQPSISMSVKEEHVWHRVIVEKLLNLVLDVKKLN